MCRAAVRKITLTNFGVSAVARLYNDKHFSFPIFARTPKVISRQMHARAARSDAYDAPVNYRRASGNAHDGNILKAWYIIPLLRHFVQTPSYVSYNMYNNRTHCCTSQKKMNSCNYHSFSDARSLNCERKKTDAFPKYFQTLRTSDKRRE